MANYATEADFKERYPEHQTAKSGVVKQRLTEGHVWIVALAGGRLTSIAGDTDGLEALKQSEMMLAYEAMSTRPRMSGVTGQGQDVGLQEGDRARDLVAIWAKKSLGTAANLKTEKISDGPTFTPDIPESWDMDPSTSGSTST